MGFFGSLFESSSSSSSTSKTETVYNTTDKRLVVDNGGIGVTGDNANVNVLDGGAVSGALKLADSTVEKAAAMTMEILNKNNQNAAQALNFAQGAGERAMQFAFDAGKPEAAVAQKWGQWIAIIGGILAAGVALKNLKGV